MDTNVTIVEGGIELDHFDPIETVDTETDGLRIEKRVTRTDSDRGIVDLTVRTRGEEVLGSWFVEPLPAKVDPDRVAARDRVDEDRWALTDESNLEFEVVAVPGERARVGYVVTDIESTDELLEPPRIDEVQEMGAPVAGPGTDAAGDGRSGSEDSTSGADDSLASKVREALSVPSERDALRDREGTTTDETPGAIDFEFTRGADGDAKSMDAGVPTDGAPTDGDGMIERPTAADDADADVGPEEAAVTDDGTETLAATPSNDHLQAGSHGDPTGASSSGETAASTDAGGATTGSTDAGAGSTESTPVTPEEVPAVFLAQLQSGALDDEDLAALREALGIERSRSETVRLQHVEHRLTEFEAYIDAMEAFIDDNGTADEVIADLESSVDSMGDRLDRIEDDVQALDRRHEAVREALDEHDRRFSAVEDRLDGLESTVEGLESTTETLESTTTDHDQRLDEVESTTEALESTTTAHDSRLEELADRQTETSERVDESVDEVRSDLEQLADRIDSLESSWENLKAAFGGE